MAGELKLFLDVQKVFAMLWTMAVPAYLDNKQRFNSFFRQQLEVVVKNGHLSAAATIPFEGSVFDYKLVADAPKSHWQLWTEELQVCNMTQLHSKCRFKSILDN